MPRAAANLRTAQGRAFPATSWTLVFQARTGDGAGSEALGELCRRYWNPIYAYLRQRGHSPADAEDYTQQFFAELLADQTLQAACPDRGRLRSFLLAALQRSLADQTRFARRIKRGGGEAQVSLEWAREEELSFAEPLDTRDPEKLYFTAWARSLVNQARVRLRESYGSRASLYAELECYLDDPHSGPPYGEAAVRLGISEVTVRVHVSRLRQRFAEIFRRQVRETVESDADTEAEIAWVIQALR